MNWKKKRWLNTFFWDLLFLYLRWILRKLKKSLICLLIVSLNIANNFVIAVCCSLLFSNICICFRNWPNRNFLRWINWYFVETNIDSCVFAHLIFFLCNFRSVFKVSISVLFIVMIITLFTKFDVVVLKLSSMHVSNSSAL